MFGAYFSNSGSQIHSGAAGLGGIFSENSGVGSDFFMPDHTVAGVETSPAGLPVPSRRHSYAVKKYRPVRGISETPPTVPQDDTKKYLIGAAILVALVAGIYLVTKKK